MIGKPVNIQGINTTYFPDIAIHDKNFFIVNKNPKAIPSLRVLFDFQYTSLNVYVEVTKVSKMNRVSFFKKNLDISFYFNFLVQPDRQCNQDTKYSFSDCVNLYNIKTTGCRLKWDDGEKSKEYEICQHMDQIKLALRKLFIFKSYIPF